MRGLGYEVSSPADQQHDPTQGRGNAAWQRAQQLAAERDARRRRN